MLSAGAMVAALAACGGLVSMPMTDARRIEMARRVAAQPMPNGFPSFLEPYDPALGPASTTGANLAGRHVHHVHVPLNTQLGPIPVHTVRLGFGPPGHFDDISLERPLNPEHVLHEIYVEIPRSRCNEVLRWLNRAYGPTPSAGRWDGITHVIQIRGVGRAAQTASCSIWWTYWIPDVKNPYTFLDRKRAPAESRHDIEPDFRVPYGRAWLAGAARVLQGEPVETVLSTLDTAALDGRHRDELVRHLTRLEGPRR